MANKRNSLTARADWIRPVSGISFSSMDNNNKLVSPPSPESWLQPTTSPEMLVVNGHDDGHVSVVLASQVSAPANNIRHPGENSEEDPGGFCRGGCGPVLANSLAYFGAAVTFIFAVNVKFLPKVPFPVIGNALTSNYWLLDHTAAAIVPLLLWAFHFMRRFSEVLFVHRYSRKMPIFEAVGASVYYWGFGFWIGYSANFYLEYVTPVWPILVPGILIFLIGEAGNCAAHLAQRQLRSSNRNRNPLLRVESNKHIIPRGMLFRLVSCPNYTFEIVTWIGYSLVVFTLPAALFAVSSTITLFVYAYRRHSAYKTEFNGKNGRELYPTNRKALIPFIF